MFLVSPRYVFIFLDVTFCFMPVAVAVHALVCLYFPCVYYLLKVELSTDELELVLQTLVYDGRLEEVCGSVVYNFTSAGSDGPQKFFKVSKSAAHVNHLTDTPCGMCPVASKCSDEGIISPKTCVYLSCWLSMATDEDGELF